MVSAKSKKSNSRDERLETSRAGLCWMLAGLFLFSALIGIGKFPWLPTSEFLRDQASLTYLPPEVQKKLVHILFIPLGALLVVFVRLSLGIRLLGPFRSILLAVTFQATGSWLGLIVLAATIAIMVTVRPWIRRMKLPYFGRITVTLSVVAVLMVFGVMSARWLHWDQLHTIALFPIVVLCLVADAFARTMIQEGIRSALWRGWMTAMVAVVLAWLASFPVMRDLLLAYPELLVAQIGAIIGISEFCGWRLLENWNPKVGTDEEEKYERIESAERKKIARRKRERDLGKSVRDGVTEPQRGHLNPQHETAGV